MRRFPLLLTISAGFCLWLSLAGCTTTPATLTGTPAIEQSRLPEPNLRLDIAGLGPCADIPDRQLSLRRGEPITLLVHGCYGSAGRLRHLAQVFAHQGQQAICYSYDDRRSLAAVAAELRLSLEQLGRQAEPARLTLIGHSQGGLIARHALQEQPDGSGTLPPHPLQLITLSSPFSGIRAADHCASPIARIVSLGLVVPICRAISGEKWYEITHASDFIQQPLPLESTVASHLLIRTDEKQSCRRQAEGRCVEDDYVFSLEEQAPVSSAVDDRLIDHILQAGHAEVVGSDGSVPYKLIDLLQSHGVLRRTTLSQRLEFHRYLTQLYQTTPAFRGGTAP